jgi:hypothetical protein
MCPKAHIADLIWPFLRTTGFAQASLILIEAQGPTIRAFSWSLPLHILPPSSVRLSIAQAIYKYIVIGVFV